MLRNVATKPVEVDPDLHYLYADRNDFGELQASVMHGVDVIEGRFKKDHPISPLDAAITSLGMLDIELWRRIVVWSEGNSLHFDPVRLVQDPIYLSRQIRPAILRGQKMLAKDNLAEFRFSDNPDKILDPVAYMSMSSIASNLYERWNPTFFEMWARTGAHYASGPVIHSFLGHRSRPKFGPKHKDQIQTLLNLTDVSFALRAVQKRVLAIAGDNSPAGRHFHSMSGLLNEIDGLVYLYEQTASTELARAWSFPASPNMDFGSANSEKADLFTVVFGQEDIRAMIFRYSVKMRNVKRNGKPPHNNINLLGANTIGNCVLRDGEVVYEPGVLCDAVYESLQPAEDHDNDEPRRVSRGLALLGVSIGESRAIVNQRPPLPHVNYSKHMDL